MNQLISEHIPWVKVLLVQKLALGEKEVVFDERVKRAITKYHLSKRIVWQLIRDLPIRKLKALNANSTRYEVEIAGMYGGKSLCINLEMRLDKSGLDFTLKNITISH